MKAFCLILLILSFLAMGVGYGYEAKTNAYLLETGQLTRIPVVTKHVNRKYYSVGFWLNNDIQYLSLTKDQYDTVAVGNLIEVLHSPGTDYVTWPKDISNVKSMRQKVMCCFLMAAFCGGFLFWHWKPKSVA